MLFEDSVSLFACSESQHVRFQHVDAAVGVVVVVVAALSTQDNRNVFIQHSFSGAFAQAQCI